MKTIAIIPAGGSGKRMGGETPKQFLALAGIPILIRSLLPFERSRLIDEILLVVPEASIPEVRPLIDRYRIGKVRELVRGGRERQDSVRNGLSRLDDEDALVVIHDGVRPFVTEGLIARVAAAAAESGAATCGLPIRDTVKQVDGDGRVLQTVPREGLWLTQTPQAFRKAVIATAHERAAAEGFCGTDDASLVERAGFPVRMVAGEPDNIKLTAPGDLLRGESILGRRPAVGGEATGAIAVDPAQGRES